MNINERCPTIALSKWIYGRMTELCVNEEFVHQGSGSKSSEEPMDVFEM
jgi:hypothetical protein